MKADPNPLDRHRIVWVDVNCPMCGNVNRAARRRCGTCRRTGLVKKSITYAEALARGLVER